MRLDNPSDNVISLIGMSDIPARKRYKINIYLNGLKNCVVNQDGNTTLISIEGNATVNNSRVIKELYDFLNTLVGEIECSEDFIEIIRSENKRKEENESLIASLKELKTGSIETSKSFEDFKAFCDGHLKILLRSYQYKAAYLLSVGKGGLDFSVPGAGKTIITYAVYSYLKYIEYVDRIFVIGPLSAYNAWIDEYQLCFGHEAGFMNLAVSSKSECQLYLKASSKYHREVTFINVDKIRLLAEEIAMFLNSSKTLLVIDEAHKIKSPNAKSTQAAISVANYATSRILLTGTPMPNGYEDLCSLMKVFSPNDDILPFRYPQLKAMSKNGATPIEFKRIRDSIAPYYSRISKKYLLESGELKAPDIYRIHVVMDTNQRVLYDRLDSFCNKLNEDIDEDFLMAMKKAALIRKMQISANPALLKKSLLDSMDELYAQYSTQRDDADMLVAADQQVMALFNSSSIVRTVNRYAKQQIIPAKNQRAVELVSSLVAAGKKVLLWDVFIQNMLFIKVALEEKFPGRIEMINGSVSAADRQIAIRNFREGSSIIMIANPATLAESISLHRACQAAVYINRNFNCAQFIQSKDRIHRINMPEGTTATYYILINEECVDESIDERLELKERRMLEILDADDIVVGGAEYEDSAAMSNQDVNAAYRR